MKNIKSISCFTFCFALVSVLAIVWFNSNVVSADNTETSVKIVEPAPETRCGWFSNPTPANAWLNDSEGEWTISIQGGYQAEGDYPDFKPSQWVKTNGPHGYGCACMKVTTDKSEMKILKIFSATARPLSACRKDKKLKKP
jgi:Protein of unknown function (DUF4087)